MDHLRPTPGTKKSYLCSLPLNDLETESIYSVIYLGGSVCILVNRNVVSHIFGLNDDHEDD
ncbi:hypothetical protein BXY53_1138 [Dichotomicrobium thermohalophilum]|uniref:Uncharacterized protein n=1 Tax=Dichotomicrobium thermohalophilum TaxID=933063 RepID=A0A397QD80_9HYPH|nr:hypothetical protein BXY53_1138 [Dichotomicrobium thermohalophilum]